MNVQANIFLFIMKFMLRNVYNLIFKKNYELIFLLKAAKTIEKKLHTQ